MIFNLKSSVEHVLVLGAGASVDYGLPTWKDLCFLIEKKINNDAQNNYQYKKEILDWVKKVGEKNKYNTIDECIKVESASKEYHSNGHEIENQIFLIIKYILDEVYKEHDEGWVKILNEKILSNTGDKLENRLAFVNYNYDNVLAKNFLNFTYLPIKHQIFNYKVRLDELSEIVVPALFPHGCLFSTKEQGCPSHLYKNSRTMKSGNGKYLDVVSCYESERHRVVKEFSPQSGIKLYILGLGGGLQVNLNNIDFINPIAEIHLTIKDPSIKDETIKFLSEKYKITMAEIRVYETCKELIEGCF